MFILFWENTSLKTQYKQPNLVGTQDITTEHLDLRKFKLRDAQQLYDWTKDEKVNQFLLESELKNIVEAEHIIISWREQYQNDDYFLWCIQLAENKKAIGKISATINLSLSSAEISYMISPDMRGKGYATEAVLGVINFLHNEVGIHRVTAKINTDNIASIKTAEKVGMQLEGILQDALLDRNKKFYDVALFSKIKDIEIGDKY